jgi:hypothetical protein
MKGSDEIFLNLKIGYKMVPKAEIPHCSGDIGVWKVTKFLRLHKISFKCKDAK